MILNIAKHESVGGIEGGVYYFNLVNYPQISLKELKIAVAFIMYEKAHHRETELVCDNESVLAIIMQHPGYVFDGYHPAKAKDEITLSDYLFACIVPAQYRTELAQHILPELA